MKTNNIFLAICATAASIISSCSMLDVEPQTTWSDRNFMTEDSHVLSTLYGGYSRLQSALGYGGFVIYGDLRADIYQLNDPTQLAMEKVLNNNLDINMSQASWANFYNVIKQANLVLKFAPELLESGVLTETKANLYMGQAYCMRAYTYFWIVRIWGDAPLVLEPYLYETDKATKTRSSVSDVLLQAHKDLTRAKELLLSTNQSRVTFTRTAAYAIDAQIYAWEKNWKECINAANAVLGASGITTTTYKLTSLYDASIDASAADFTSTTLLDLEYAKMFNEGEASESIFELAYSVDDMNSNNTLFAYLADNYVQIKPRDEISIQFEDGDWRRYVAFGSSATTNTRARKFFLGGYVRNQDSRNIVLLRTAETALLKAEALLNLNDTESDEEKIASNVTEAMKLVNAIRNRAGGSDFEITSSVYENQSNEELKQTVAQERLKELIFEGYRYFDLIRTGKVFEVMEPINGQNDERSLVWPIRLTEIQNSNGLIEQNEYYK